MKSYINVEKQVAIPKTLRQEPTREQLALQVMVIEYDASEYYYDVDGYTIYAKASNGLWKISDEDFKYLHISKN